MMLKRAACSLAILGLIVVLTLGSIPARAEGVTELTYGKEAPGKLSAGETVAYEFRGDKGDLVVLQVIPAWDNGLISSEVKIADDKGKTVADSSKVVFFSRTGSMVGAELSKTGTYEITVFTTNKSDKGDFTILLVRAQELEKGTPIEDTVESTPYGERSSYKKIYAIRPDLDAQLVYGRKNGDYAPSVVVYALTTGNSLYPTVFMGGSNFTGGSLAITNQEDVYFVTVGAFSFASSGSSDNTVQKADFRLTLETKSSDNPS